MVSLMVSRPSSRSLTRAASKGEQSEVDTEHDPIRSMTPVQQIPPLDDGDFDHEKLECVDIVTASTNAKPGTPLDVKPPLFPSTCAAMSMAWGRCGGRMQSGIIVSGIVAPEPESVAQVGPTTLVRAIRMSGPMGARAAMVEFPSELESDAPPKHLFCRRGHHSE